MNIHVEESLKVADEIERRNRECLSRIEKSLTVRMEEAASKGKVVFELGEERRLKTLREYFTKGTGYVLIEKKAVEANGYVFEPDCKVIVEKLRKGEVEYLGEYDRPCSLEMPGLEFVVVETGEIVHMPYWVVEMDAFLPWEDVQERINEERKKTEGMRKATRKRRLMREAGRRTERKRTRRFNRKADQLLKKGS